MTSDLELCLAFLEHERMIERPVEFLDCDRQRTLTNEKKSLVFNGLSYNR